MNIKEILDKIAEALKSTVSTDADASFDGEAKSSVIVPKTEQETKNDYLKSYTSLFETYKFPDLEEVLESNHEEVKKLLLTLLIYLKNKNNQSVASNGSIYTKSNIAVVAQSLLPQLVKLNKLGLAEIAVDEETKKSLEQTADYFLHVDKLTSASTGVYTLADMQDFIQVIEDIIKDFENALSNIDLGKHFSIDYTAFIHNLNDCYTNIKNLYEKAYIEAEKSIQIKDPNDSIENHLDDIVLTETDSSIVSSHIKTFTAICETKESDFSRLAEVLRSHEFLTDKELAAYLFEFGNISIIEESKSNAFVIRHKVGALSRSFSSILKTVEDFKNLTNKYSYSKIDTYYYNILKTVIENTKVADTGFVEPIKDAFHTSSSTVIDMPKFILTLRSHLMNNPIFNKILTCKNIEGENFNDLLTKENLLTLMGCVCEALNEYYQNSPLSVYTNFKFDLSQEYPEEMDAIPLASISHSLNTYTLKVYENSIDKLIEKHKDNPVFVFEYVVSSIIHEFGHYADLVSKLTDNNKSNNQEPEKSPKVLSNLDFSTLFLLTLISPSIQEYLNSNELYKSANDEDKLKYLYALVDNLKTVLNYNEYADDKKEMFARYFSFESTEMLLDLLKVTPTVNPENVEFLKAHIHESASIVSASKEFQIESNKARELLKNLSEELSSVISPVYLSRLLFKWANIPAYNLNFGNVVNPVSISEFDKKSKQLLDDYIKSLSPDQVYELAIESIERKCPELFDFICDHTESLNSQTFKSNKDNHVIFSKIDELVKMLDESMSIANQSVSMEHVCKFVYNQIFELNIKDPIVNKYFSQILNLESEAKKCDASRFDKEITMRAIYDKLIVALANLDEELYKKIPAIVKIYDTLNQDIEPIIKLVEERANVDEKHLNSHNIDFKSCKVYDYLTEEKFKELFDYFIKNQNVNALYLITNNIYSHRNRNSLYNGVAETSNLEYYAKELLSLPKSKKLSKTYIDMLISIWMYLKSDSALANAVFQETETLRDELKKMREYVDETFFKPSAPALTEGKQNSNE